jgi:hypothetical protein
LIIQTRSKEIIIHVYCDEDTITYDDGIDLLSQHQSDSFHLIQHARVETPINDFKGDHNGGNILNISSSCSTKMSTSASDLLFTFKKLTRDRTIVMLSDGSEWNF